jgi:hypothetical protein
VHWFWVAVVGVYVPNGHGVQYVAAEVLKLPAGHSFATTDREELVHQ